MVFVIVFFLKVLTDFLDVIIFNTNIHFRKFVFIVDNNISGSTRKMSSTGTLFDRFLWSRGKIRNKRVIPCVNCFLAN